MIPISLLVVALQVSGVLGIIAHRLDPIMRILGLEGQASLVFITAMVLNNYSAIAVIGTLPLYPREIIILASMCLIAHNLIVESTVMRKTGSSVTKMVLLRVGTALIAGWLLNRILPRAPRTISAGPASDGSMGFPSMDKFLLTLKSWAIASGFLIIKVAVIVTALMILQKILEEFGVMEWLGKIMGPLMRFFGLPISTGFLWIVANIAGLAYGSAIMIDRVETDQMTLYDADLFNHHGAISHSLLEDTLLFMAIGVPLFWAILPRLILAVLVVWLERLRRIIFRRSFRVGTI
jgi:spore maturation protein SpmB